jgi:divalent metal cation (Fe/Co/Zn/Cd) transporter
MAENSLRMAETFPIVKEGHACAAYQQGAPKSVLWLQCITLAWMATEAGISLYAAVTARSIALLAFGSDSLVELLSAGVVLLSFWQRVSLSRDRAARSAGVLLFVLAGVIAMIAVSALLAGVTAEVSPASIAVTTAALLVMPILAWFKRTLGRKTDNRALMADAVQSATCAYLAAITLISLAVNAVFHIRWIDSVAALVVLPILVIEGKRALRGEPCSCC